MIGVGIDLMKAAVLGGDANAQLGVGLLGQATSYLNGIAPYHWFDFINDRCLYASNDVGGVSGATGYSFARASVGTYRNADGTTTQFSSGQLRRGNRGVLIEGARTNLFLNSATGANQSPSVTAVAHTLSFEGTGTITLTGASIAGPLVGTGALNRVSLTFTPTAAPLVMVITGTVERVNLEAGAFASSWIPTAGSSVTRAADVLTCTAGVSYPLSLWAEFERAVDTGGDEEILRVAFDGNERSSLSVRSTGDLARAIQRTAAADVADLTVGSALGLNLPHKMAARFALNSVRLACAGTLSTEDTVAALPTNPVTLTFGQNGTPFGYIRRAAILNSALSDANLQSVTT